MLEVRRSEAERVTEQAAGTHARTCVLVPAFQAEATLPAVLADLAAELANIPVFVVDDGSTDGTAEVARAAGATVLRHAKNLGKGAALTTGLRAAQEGGFAVAVSVDADGQHPAAEARAVLFADDDPRALVLGVRDLAAANAPRANRFSNGISNHFLSRFARMPLRDTQCGLRRYPVNETLALGAHARGYAFEAEALLFAARTGLRIVEVPVRVVYPAEGLRTTHFDSVRDPMRIIAVVLRTLARLRRA
jgi:glycosyltransferase involved in cell wall biosynthesis